MYIKLSASNLVSGRNSAAAAPAATIPLHNGTARTKAVVRKIIAPILECMSYKLSAETMATLKRFRPNVVYTLGGSMRQLKLAMNVAETLRVPFVIHFMDDWPATLYQSPLLMPFRARLSRLTLAAVGRAKARLVISGAMASEYRDRFGRNFVPFMNCVTRAQVRKPGANGPAPVNDICYFGGLHLGRGDVVLQLANAIEQFRSGQEVQTDLYCRPSDVVAYTAAFLPHKCLRFREAVAPDQVAKVMQTAGALLHVESFTAAHRKYTRLSVSTKIPEYLASGRPILAIGPAEVASIQYLQENSMAVVVTNTEPSAIVNGLEQLRDPATLSRITKNAFETVLKNHISEVERDRFRNVLAQAAFN